MREINRNRYLRGTKAWTVRNLFVFGTLAVTVLFGTASVLMLPGLSANMQKKSEDERKAKVAKREKIRAIRTRREELDLEKSRARNE